MKKTVLIVLLSVCAVWGNGVQADIGAAGKRDGVIVGSILAGAVLGGPLGFVAGSFGGAWLGEQVYAADAMPALQADLATTRSQLISSGEQLAVTSRALREARSQNLHYAQIVMDQLELAMLFKTGASGLTASGQQRVDMLAAFLKDNPDVDIRLDGYADPRGEAAFNQKLSEQRVDHVRNQLVAQGVPSTRISSHAHGKSRSQSSEGDLDAYALERVVTIQLTQDAGKQGFAASH